jgi:hypothetical protein
VVLLRAGSVWDIGSNKCLACVGRLKANQSIETVLGRHEIQVPEEGFR